MSTTSSPFLRPAHCSLKATWGSGRINGRKCSARLRRLSAATRPLKATANATRNAPTSLKEKPFYITTPIFYVNAAPHVGHMYTMVLADVIKRYQLLSGKEAILCTGTDEHGLKVQQAAERANTSPQPFCDKGAQLFKNLAARCDISQHLFARTSDSAHREAVQYVWQILKEKGFIYTSKHEGWYSVSDETFYPESAVHLVVDAPTGRKHMASMETGKEVEWTDELNYHFRLSAFRDRLLELYRAKPDWIIPAQRHKYIYNSIKNEGLQDLSISRPAGRLAWGVPVPDDSSQTIYVWLDALITYVAMAGYPWSPEKAFAGGWPADVHIIGKDILRFHCIYWPAFLMALGLPLPNCILTHAHWTLGKQKMSKSTGNVVSPFHALDRFGVDVMRFYLVHDGGIVDDANYANEHIIERYKHCLQGQLGNLASRVMRAKRWNVRDVIRGVQKTGWKGKGTEFSADHIQWKALALAEQEVRQEMRDLEAGAALQSIMNLIYKTNAYMQHAQPWNVLPSKDETSCSRLSAIIYVCVESLRISGIMLQPFMPNKAACLLDMLGVEQANRTLDHAKVGMDFEYGASKVDLGQGQEGTLFPPLNSDE